MASNAPSGKWHVAKTRIRSLEELTPGDHIYMPMGGEYGLRRHMIVAEINIEAEKVKVIHYNNRCKDSTKPILEVIETWEKMDFQKSDITRMIYDPKDSYSPDEVLRRAQHSVGKKAADLVPIIPPENKWTWYSASCYFAEWCYTGQGWERLNLTNNDGQLVW